MDALELRRADLVGNSMGGRVAIEVGLRFPSRTGRLALLAPSLAWLHGRRFAPLLRLVPPQLGLLQPTPRALAEWIVRHLVPGAAEGWTAAAVDEFLRSYLTPRGRAAFYAAARNIYLEEPSARTAYGRGCRACRLRACSSAGAATGSCRSASNRTSARRCRPRCTWSWTAGTSRSSRRPCRPIGRC
jgi:pimeloyl-ACP methyl ester carboxylesterase